MIRTSYPGIYFDEVKTKTTPLPIQGVDMSIGAIVGYFEKGPIGKPIKVSISNFETIFGGPIPSAYSWYALNGFFQNGGRECWVVRTTHYNEGGVVQAKNATITLKDKATVGIDTLTFTSVNEGKWGNNISLKISDSNLVKTKTIGAKDVGTTTIQLSAVKDIYVGQTLTITIDDTDKEEVVVSVIDETTRTITVEKPTVKAIPANCVVTSNDFDLTVLYKGSVVEQYTTLTMDEKSEKYILTAFNDTPSAFVTVEDEFSTNEFPKNLPISGTFTLTGGTDGLEDVTYKDIIGNKEKKTGIYAFDIVTDVLNFFVVESCDESLYSAILQYSQNRMDCDALLTTPSNTDYASAIEYMNNVGSFNSSYGFIYYQWGYVKDPIGKGDKAEKLVPLIGHIAGAYSKNDQNYGLGQVPAGENAGIVGVLRLQYELDDIQIGELNLRNLNCLKKLNDRGIVIWGARTLSYDTKWKYINSRRIFIYVEKSIALGTRWAIFKPSNKQTWSTITRIVSSFLNTVPGLFGDSPEERYLVQCDETTNPKDVQLSGKIFCKIGLNIESVGEFIVFEIGHLSDMVTVEE